MYTSQCHAVTVDLEDWYHVCAAGEPLHHQPLQGRVAEATGLVLDLLQQYDIKSTFFILGSVAAQYPALIERIAAAGHEIASHGWSHRMVFDLQPDEFGEELFQTSRLLQAQTGQRPYGFRAPRWSLCRKKTAWAFELLAQQGYRYDSSLTPLASIGDPDGPRGPHLVETPSGTLWELPPLVTGSLLGNLPTGGGWGFRFFPQRMIASSLQQYGSQGIPGVIFIHPRELDPDGPRLPLGLLRSFVTYGPRSGSQQRLSWLFERFRFKTMGALIDSWQPAS